MDWLTTLLADQALQNALIGLFGVLLTIIIKRAAGAFQAATGIEVDRNAREVLKEAIMSGVKAMLAENPQAGLEQIKAYAIYHARESVPDAIAHLVPGEGVLDRLALRAYREAMEGAGIAMPPTSGAATTRSVSTAVPRR